MTQDHNYELLSPPTRVGIAVTSGKSHDQNLFGDELLMGICLTFYLVFWAISL